MNFVEQLNGDLEAKAAHDADVNKNNFTKDVELTPEDQERIEKLKDNHEKALMVSEIADGKDVKTPVEEFVKNMDADIAALSADGDKVLKLVNSGDIKRTTDQIKKDTEDKAMKMFRDMAVDSVDEDAFTNEDIMDITDEAMLALKAYYHKDDLNAETIVGRLRKMPLSRLVEIMPKRFVDMYVSPNEILANNFKAKDRLLTVVEYMIISGPELDMLNTYIDEENRKILIHQRIMTCRFDLEQVLQSKETLSDIISKTLTIAPPDTTFWAKYIKQPNHISNIFAQNVVLYEQYRNAYVAILSEYEEDDQLARSIIGEQLEECDAKIAVYSDVLNLELMNKLWEILTERLKNNKKCSHDFLQHEAVEAIERIRRCKQDLPFPNYNPNEKRSDQIYKNYLSNFTKMLTDYNSKIFEIRSKEIKPNEDQPKGSEVGLISIPGYFDPGVLVTFSTMLIIVMGRLVKNLAKPDMSKYDVITLDAYFNLFCRLGQDIYIMSDVWNMMSDFVKYTIDNYPVTVKGRK